MRAKYLRHYHHCPSHIELLQIIFDHSKFALQNDIQFRESPLSSCVYIYMYIYNLYIGMGERKLNIYHQNCALQGREGLLWENTPTGVYIHKSIMYISINR